MRKRLIGGMLAGVVVLAWLAPPSPSPTSVSKKGKGGGKSDDDEDLRLAIATLSGSTHG